MITAVEVRNGQGDTLTLTLNDPAAGYLIEEIGGLGPVKATLFSSSFAGQDGESYQGNRREARDITFKINLVPDFVTKTVGDLRDELSWYFMPGSQVSLRFLTDALTPKPPYYDIVGRVETNEPALFTSEPSIDISVRCFNPDFLDPRVWVTSGNTVSTSTTRDIIYDGTIPTGFLFTLNVNRALGSFSIYQTTPLGELKTMDFSTTSLLQPGDVLQISTINGAKGVTLIRGGSQSSYLYGISPQSDWLKFSRGVNQMRVAASGAAIPYTFQHTQKYGGL